MKWRLVGLIYSYADEDSDENWVASASVFRATIEPHNGEFSTTMYDGRFGKSQITGSIKGNFVSFIQTYGDDEVEKGAPEGQVEFNFAPSSTHELGMNGHWWVIGTPKNGGAILSVKEVPELIDRILAIANSNDECLDRR